MKEGFEVYQQYTKQGFEAKQGKKVELFYGLNRFVYNVYFRNGPFHWLLIMTNLPKCSFSNCCALLMPDTTVGTGETEAGSGSDADRTGAG